MNLVFFVGLFLFIKYSEAKSIAEDPNESACYFNRTMGVQIKLDDLNPLCEGCCDDLIDDYELKINIESRLDFTFFDYRGDIAQRRGETNIYKEMKICVKGRPLISCVDLCLCKNVSCIYDHIKRLGVLDKAFNCTKKKIRSEFKNKQISLTDLDDASGSLGVARCWNGLSKEEIYLVKLKLIEKLSLNLMDTDDQSQEQDKSNELNNSIESTDNPSPIKNSSSSLLQLALALQLIMIIACTNRLLGHVIETQVYSG